jgi:hypothetical protein
MFDPASLTLGQVSSALRDFAIVGFLIGGAWKARGMFDAGKRFFERLTTHMEVMERGMNTLLTNHLPHIEEYTKKMSHHQVRANQFEQDVYTTEDAPEL